MIARVKIYKGQTPVEELQQVFQDELKGIMEDAAIKMGCTLEKLKYRIDNMGHIEVQKMTPQEIMADQNQREVNSRKRKILRIKGIN